jgi:DinB superfamily
MKASEAEIAVILLSMREGPSTIKSACSKVSTVRLNLKSQQDSWSVHDVLAHVCSCADVWGGSIEVMLREEMPTLAYVHPHAWLKQTDYRDLGFHLLLGKFTAQRQKLIKTLMKLPFKDWSRGAMIGGRVHTVFTQARRIAKHEAIHYEQIEGLLKKNG